jgi:hypothetical protein
VSSCYAQLKTAWRATQGTGFPLESFLRKPGFPYPVRMAHTYEELKKKTIAELRDIAKDLSHDAVQGYTQMNKEHLLPALCKALGIDAHEHHAAALAQKTAVKARLSEIKAARAKALTDGNHDLLRQLRRQYHRLNHALRSSAKRAM